MQKRDPMRRHLQGALNTKAKVRRADAKGAAEVSKSLLGKLEIAMRQLDPLFDLMTKSRRAAKLVGSASRNLKVGKPDEFDVDLRLELPLRDGGDVAVAESGDFASWFSLSFPAEAWTGPPLNALSSAAKLFDIETLDDCRRVCHLQADGLRRWMQVG